MFFKMVALSAEKSFEVISYARGPRFDSKLSIEMFFKMVALSAEKSFLILEDRGSIPSIGALI